MKTFGKFVLTLTGFSVLFLATAFATTNTLQVFDEALAGDYGVPPATHVDPVIKVGDTVQWVWKSSNHSTTSGTPGTPNGLCLPTSETTGPDGIAFPTQPLSGPCRLVARSSCRMHGSTSARSTCHATVT